VRGDLLQQILKGVQGSVAFSVIAPVASFVVGPIWHSLLPPAAIRVIARRVAAHDVIGVDVDVCQLQNFQFGRVRLTQKIANTKDY
jgi:hypothetical protein